MDLGQCLRTELENIDWNCSKRHEIEFKTNSIRYISRVLWASFKVKLRGHMALSNIPPLLTKASLYYEYRKMSKRENKKVSYP